MTNTNSRPGSPLFGTIASVQRGYMDLMERTFGRSVEVLTQQSQTSLELFMQQTARSLDLLRRSQETFGQLTPVLTPVQRYPDTSAVTNIRDSGRSSDRNEEIVAVGEEVLMVGKRLQHGAKTIVHRTVTESPVEENVQLVTQTVTVERRRAEGSRAGDVLTDKTVEMTDVTEVPVVSKSVRLVEEVIIRRDTSTRNETIRDTVKKDVVQVEQPTRMPAIYNKDQNASDGRSQRQERQERQERARNGGQDQRMQPT